MKRITTVSALKRAMSDFDWKTLRFDSHGTMIVQSKENASEYTVPEQVWRAPSSPFNEQGKLRK